MTRWFYDTEFNEDGRTIDLISIALVAENGHFYYAVSSEFDEARCNPWVKEHVLPHLPPRGTDFWKSRAEIAADIRAILLEDGEKPELWAYFGDYDHVALCQLYGRMVDLPKGLPFLTLDLKQRMIERGIKKEDLPPQRGAEHDALADARWVREAFLAMEGQRRAGAGRPLCIHPGCERDRIPWAQLANGQMVGAAFCHEHLPKVDP